MANIVSIKTTQLIWLLMLQVALGSLSACSNKESRNRGSEEKISASAQVSAYTCPMHPQIVKDQPSTCPICGMDLVPFDKNHKDALITLSTSQQALGNITSAIINIGDFSNFTRLNGILVTDPTKTKYISSRVAGRIEQLYVRETGVPVRIGQPLYSIYSEELSVLQQEYLLAANQAMNFPENEKFKQLEIAAKQKLGLYGQSASQIRELLTTQKVSTLTTFFAPGSGVVARLSVTEGQYVPEGGDIMMLESYETLWVEAVVYPSEWNAVKPGQTVTVVIPGYETSPLRMTISFLTPALEEGRQQIKIRGTLNNPELRWQPGLQAVVHLPSGAKPNVISVPAGAVIREESGARIWIEKEPGIYEPRKVVTGLEASGRIEITEGLQAGEKVVVTGAYLLYSEYVLKKGKQIQ